jgi:hypothetical protein
MESYHGRNSVVSGGLQLIEELRAGKDPQGVFSQDRPLAELKKARAERIGKMSLKPAAQAAFCVDNRVKRRGTANDLTQFKTHEHRESYSPVSLSGVMGRSRTRRPVA